MIVFVLCRYLKCGIIYVIRLLELYYHSGEQFIEYEEYSMCQWCVFFHCVHLQVQKCVSAAHIIFKRRILFPCLCTVILH